MSQWSEMKKDPSFPRFVIVWTAVVFVGILLGALSLVLIPPHKRETNTITRPLPLTRFYSQEDNWVVKTNFEPIHGTNLISVAEVHKPTEKEGINRLGMLDLGSCPGAIVVMPSVGDKVSIMHIETRVINSASGDIVGNDFISMITIVKPACQ
jgi:hypothetical protein